MRRVLAAACLAAALSAPAAAGELRGRVELAFPGVALADVGPVVVYLEGGEGAPRPPASAPAAEIRQHSASFSPPFLAVARGQGVAMPNDDAIYHNVFSFSAPNDFDLGLYPGGESRSVAFQHPGVVRIFCSIHESMNGTLFVSPTPWFAVVDADGRFAIPGVPAGRFRLRSWAAKLPPSEQEVTLGDGVSSEVVRLGGAGVGNERGRGSGDGLK
jgi:plastocyanin